LKRSDQPSSMSRSWPGRRDLLLRYASLSEDRSDPQRQRSGCPSHAGGLPVVGGWIGSTFMGLSGAAATSAGLAALGGGSLAAGGLGMAGGTMVVAGSAAAAGAGAMGAATTLLTSDLVEGKRCSRCHSLLETKDKFCSNCSKG